MSWKTKLLLVVTVVVAVAVAPSWSGRSTQPAGAQGPATSPKTEKWCAGSEASFVFSWQAQAPWDEAWVDLSLFNNGFQPGTFLGYGPATPLDPKLPLNGAIRWRGLIPGTVHYWRVNLRYGDTWYPSPTQTFTALDCAPGTALPPPIAQPADDLESLKTRVLELENCLSRYSRGCGRLADIEDRLDDIEYRLDELESRVADLEWQLSR